MNILSSAYWGNIEYYALLLTQENPIIDIYEHYTKQSYRNRCNIMTSLGVLSLSVPVVKISGGRAPIKDIEIEYATRWQSNHWRAIVSAYRNSPYFDHYEDMVAPLYHQRYRYLIEYNNAIMECVLKMLKSSAKITLSDRYIERDEGIDWRDVISPKRVSDLHHQPYYQVFSEKLPLESNLSVLDLIMCEGGSEALNIIENSRWENCQK